MQPPPSFAYTPAAHSCPLWTPRTPTPPFVSLSAVKPAIAHTLATNYGSLGGLMDVLLDPTRCAAALLAHTCALHFGLHFGAPLLHPAEPPSAGCALLW